MSYTFDKMLVTNVLVGEIPNRVLTVWHLIQFEKILQ
jgi:hypothetical protein